VVVVVGTAVVVVVELVVVVDVAGTVSDGDVVVGASDSADEQAPIRRAIASAAYEYLISPQSVAPPRILSGLRPSHQGMHRSASSRYTNDDAEAAYTWHGPCDFTGSTGLPSHIAETDPTARRGQPLA
jgi:hypothetical protein